MESGAPTGIRDCVELSAEECLTLLGSSGQGISQAESARRLRQYGPNIPLREMPEHWLQQLIRSFLSPFNAILAGIALLSLVLDVWIATAGNRDYRTLAVVLFMILLSSLLRFIQEHRSAHAAEKLRRLVRATSTVLRPGMPAHETDMASLVRGDVVMLSAGDMIPADCRVIRAKDLFVSQSVLTGESFPVEKHDHALVSGQLRLITESVNLCFQGTNVVSGSAMVVVIDTGSRTMLGAVGQSVMEEPDTTGFEAGLTRVTRILLRFVLVMVPLVFLVNGLTKGDWLGALLFSVSVAVGLTPEMLPVILTTNLARGAVHMGNHRVIVRRLRSIQQLGAMDVLCTDKTGTLTLDRVVLRRHLNVTGEEDLEVLKWAYLNSFHQTGLKSLLDRAIVDHIDEDQQSELHEVLRVDADWSKVDEIPFDFNRRRMSVVLKRPDGRHLLICKGAVDEMLQVCSHTFDPGADRQLHAEEDKVVALDEAGRAGILRMSQNLQNDGLRVMLVAIRESEPRLDAYGVDDEKNLVLTGIIAFLDPAKPSAGPAIHALRDLGISVKVLSGDQEAVTRKICRDVGLEDGEMLTGPDVDVLTEEQLGEAADRAVVMARLTPIQKARIVTALRARGHTVGFLGDGINDAPALRAADAGISVDTASDIARESADLLLLEKDLLVLRDGVVHGRRTFGNILKYIRMTTSSNFGNMVSVVFASVALPFLPMLPVQILVQNLLYDWSQAFTPWDNMDEEFIRKPVQWNTTGISRFMLVMGPVSSVFDLAIFSVLWFVLVLREPSSFQSGWFVEGLLSQALIVHLVRTARVPFLESRASMPMLMATALIMAVGIWLPFSPLASSLGMVALPGAYFPWLFVVLIGYFLLVQVVKKIYIRRFGSWL